MAMPPLDSSSILAMRNSILQQNSALQKAATSGDPAGGAGGASRSEGAFGGALQKALGKVNDMQSQASEASAAYERGETTDIAAVMLTRQQASIGFQATLQVRNKLLSAYRDIMSMPV
jgi:flagellar hook-basal body complex protein FliE